MIKLDDHFRCPGCGWFPPTLGLGRTYCTVLDGTNRIVCEGKDCKKKWYRPGEYLKEQRAAKEVRGRWGRLAWRAGLTLLVVGLTVAFWPLIERDLKLLVKWWTE